MSSFSLFGSIDRDIRLKETPGVSSEVGFYSIEVSHFFL